MPENNGIKLSESQKYLLLTHLKKIDTKIQEIRIVAKEIEIQSDKIRKALYSNTKKAKQKT